MESNGEVMTTSSETIKVILMMSLFGIVEIAVNLSDIRRFWQRPQPQHRSPTLQPLPIERRSRKRSDRHRFDGP